MPIGLTIDTNIPEIRRHLRDFERRQLPFATSLAINWTLGDARDGLVDALPRRFTIRNNYLEKGIRIRPSSKRKLEGRVFTVDEILLLQITGGTKSARGHAIALPRDAKTNAKGIIRKGNRPRALRAKPRHFVAPVRRGDRGLFKRRTKKRYPIDFLWRLHSGSVKIDSSFDFAGIASRIIRKTWERNFGRAFARALKGARR